MNVEGCPTCRCVASQIPPTDGQIAAAWALFYGWPWVDDLATVADHDPPFTHALVQAHNRLEAHALCAPARGPLFIDFLHGAATYRQQQGGGVHQALARAIGLKKGHRPTVIDATAGVGRDAFVLASLGCTVQMVERVPLLAAVLDDGLCRLQAEKDCPLSLIIADARAYLHYRRMTTEEPPPAVVYLDPMYPARNKQALPRKEMQTVRELAGGSGNTTLLRADVLSKKIPPSPPFSKGGVYFPEVVAFPTSDDPDTLPELLACALACATERVVLKRPQWAPPLAAFPPHATIQTEKTRFDLYKPAR